ncbi:MAG: hypothetical protein HN644_03650 [Rhodospirillales bacterium]|nr:hypothetical protein [Rhodospirillales bacterium]
MNHLPTTMKACLLVGNGGLEMLEIHNDVAVPTVVPGDVLIKVHACGMNNDIYISTSIVKTFVIIPIYKDMNTKFWSI